jgi:phage recombination protein Bet
MTNEIAIQNNNLEMLSTLRNSVAPGLTDNEFMLFAEMVKATGLNPVTKEVWAIKAGGRLQIMTGINGFLRIANAHPAYDGMEVEYERDGDKIIAATAKVYRKDRRFPSVATAFMSEYAKPTPIWKTMPSIMLSKCAKSLALREAFVQELGGLYTQEEMPAEFAPQRETTIPKEDLIVSEKTGRVIGTKPKATTMAKVEAAIEDLPETKAGLKESIVEAAKGLIDDSNLKLEVYYDLSPLSGDKLTACETYILASNGKRVSGNIWKSLGLLERAAKYVKEDYSE